MEPVLDLNCDLGEGFGVWRLGDDEALLDVVTSANIACGFHGGDPTIMRRACEKAASNGVSIGAHVGYRDLVGFGRRPMTIQPADLANEVIYQVAALDGIARAASSRVRYVKPHGALYNTVVADAEQAAAVVDAVRSYDSSLVILGLPDSQLLRLAADANLTTVREAFGDRAYHSDGTLVSRHQPGSVITSATAVADRCLEMARTGQVSSVDGEPVNVQARSVCIHGDTPGAVELVRRVRDILADSGVAVSAFA